MTDLMQRFSSDAQPGHPNVTPKDASTLILLDHSGPSPKVLMGKRHQRHTFLPGSFVFPGGGVDAADRLMPVGARLDPRAEAKLMLHMRRPSAAKAQGLALAAIRETFEETGYTFVPSHLVGIYHWQNETGTTFVRFAFCGKHTAPTGPVRLDVGIIGAHWLTRAQMLAREHDLRSAMVLRAVDDYLAGARHSLDLVPYLSWERLPRSAQ